jgi:hypothetical protein
MSMGLGMGLTERRLVGLSGCYPNLPGEFRALVLVAGTGRYWPAARSWARRSTSSPHSRRYAWTSAAARCFLLGVWRDGLSGALQMGARHGGWCVGCCWALMASLFALGVISIAWMAFVAVLIAAEKIVPWRRAVTYGIAALLLVLGVVFMVAPHWIPGLTIPGNGGSMDVMGPPNAMRIP